MRTWTRASFDAALAEQAGDDPVLWLRARSEEAEEDRAARSGTFRSAASGLARAATRLGVVAGTGCLLSGLAAGSALAPVGSAHAAIDELRLAALPPVNIAVEDVPVFRPAIGDSSTEEGTAAADVEAFLQFGSRAVPRRIVTEIVRAAAATSVDPIYLMALADTESGFRPDVKAATSSAQGLFQFIDRTWLEIIHTAGPLHGLAAEAAAIKLTDEKPVVADEAERARILSLRRDPYLAAVMAAELLKRDAALIGFRIGRKLNETEMYLAHFLGLEDAVRFIALRAAKRPPTAAQAFPAAARANAPLFYETTRRKRRDLSLDQVFGKLDRLIGPRVERFRSVEADAASLRS